MSYNIYFDGASRSNPGPCSSAGVILDNNNNVLFSKTTKYECNTNNYAEYNGLINGLELAIENNLINEKILVYGDSLLVINQIKKKWKCQANNLIPLFDKVNQLITKFYDVQFIHIKRDLNKIADKLCNLKLDENN
jgi:ribonuclease HI